MDPIPLLPAVLIGLASAVHCIGMCGSIVGALTLSLPPEIREHRRRLLPFLLAYNTGRISSYATGGLLAGLLGAGLAEPLGSVGHEVLRWFSALWVALIGMHLAGWFPAFALIERVGAPLWTRIEPHARALLPVRRPLAAFAFGLLWGWLPCGLVYSTLIWSIGTGRPGDAALVMLAFGLGTLPATLATGVFTGWTTRFFRDPRLRPIVGGLLILLAAATLAWPWWHALHSGGIDADHGPATPGQEQLAHADDAG